MVVDDKNPHLAQASLSNLSPLSEPSRKRLGRHFSVSIDSGRRKINGERAKKASKRMWRSISLSNRLNLIFASLFALWLVADADP